MSVLDPLAKVSTRWSTARGLNSQLTSFKGIDMAGTKEDPIVVEDTPMTLEGKREPFPLNEWLD